MGLPFLMEMLLVTRFVLQKWTHPKNINCDVQDLWRELCGTVDVWLIVSFQTFSIYPRDRKAEKFAKRTVKRKFLGTLAYK